MINVGSIESNMKAFLGITIDMNLNLDDHVHSLCKKVCQKLNAFSQVAPFMNVNKRKTIMAAFIESQLGYCPLVWMFHSRKTNNENKTAYMK